MTSPSFRREWSEDECGHIHRLEQFCAGKAHWELRCGHTNAGEPCCVLYDRWRQRVILQIARVDLDYIVASPQGRKDTKKRTMAAAIELALIKLSAREPFD